MSSEHAVAVGVELPRVRIPEVALESLVRWAGATDDYGQIHFDTAAAAVRGLPGPVVHGVWKAANLLALLEDWLGADTVTRFKCRYMRPDVVGGSLELGGVITAVEQTADYDHVECTLWTANAEAVHTVEATAAARIPRRSVGEPDGDAGADRGLPIDQLKDALRVGEEAGRFTYRVEPNDIRRFVNAIADPDRAEGRLLDADDDLVAPATFYATLDPVERRDLDAEKDILDRIPFPMTGGGNAFNEVEYERAIRAGDVITVVTHYDDIYERNGKAGRLLFRVRLNELYDQRGDLIARSRMGHVLAFDLGTDVSGRAPIRRPTETPLAAASADKATPEGREMSGSGGERFRDVSVGLELPALVRVPSRQQLVRYAGAANDYSRIHYDDGYARERGFDSVIVHGLLKAAFLADLVEQWAGDDAWIKRISTEYRGVDLPGRPLICRGRVTAVAGSDDGGIVDLQLGVENMDRRVTTRGHATVVFSDREAKL